jgi:carboxymethylenebutenolidase
VGESVQNVSFDSQSRQAYGYLALPESGSGPGIIVIQEWWGLTSHIADLANRLAAEGFVALAPDLYGGPTTHDPAEAKELLAALPVDRAIQDLAGAVDYLLARDEVTSSTLGVIGFCMGGGFVLGMAGAQGDRISAAVPFYGMPRPGFDLSGLSCAVQGHYGTEDAGIPLDKVNDLFDSIKKSTDKPVELHTYEAGHAFLNDENLNGTYDPDNAALAWKRATQFLRANVA